MASLAEAWHTFMIRKTLLTTWVVCLNFDHDCTLRTPAVRDAASSALYVDLVSLLDEAFEARMSPADYARGKKTKNRIEMLAKAGDLLDGAGLLAVNRRRDAVAHEFNNGSNVKELEEAIGKVRAQLLAWKMVKETGLYDLAWERTGARMLNDPEWVFERDMVVRVVVDGEVAKELSKIQRVGRVV